MKALKVALYYILIVIERIYLIPFSGVRPSTMIGVFTNIYEKTRLWRRFYIGTIIYGIIYLTLKIIL